MFSQVAYLENLLHKENLNAAQTKLLFSNIFKGDLTAAQIAALLIAFRMKGETVEELVAAIEAMYEQMQPIEIISKPLIDIVGTGGDGANLFNVSTVSAFVVAEAGGFVAKHGNRSVSSQSGSADVLEKAGLSLELSPEKISECIAKTGVGFLFGPYFHPAMKIVASTRRELKVRTLFNLIGPLVNPAKVRRQLIGVFDKKWVLPIAEVLQKLNSEHALVVHAEDGLDEISIAAPTFVAELKQDHIQTYTLSPEEFGMKRASLDSLTVQSPEDSLSMIEKILQGETGPSQDIVALNAGAAIYIAGLANNINDGVKKAKEILQSGKAYQRWVIFLKC